MKNKMKIRKKAAAALLMLTAAVLLTGCMKLTFDDDTSETASGENASQAVSTSAKTASVYIIQYADYTSLNECCEGVKSSLDKTGIPYDVTVGGANHEKEDCEEKARELVTNSSCDLVIAIGTPCAETVCPIIDSASSIPVVFAAVTDPAGAGIVRSLSMPGVKCTGVSTSFDIEEQLNMINTFQPYITRLGVIYTESEQNTKQQLKTLEKAASDLGITVTAAPVSDPSQLSSTAQELMRKVEAVVLLPDNMIAMNSWNVTNRSIVEKVPLYGVTLEQVKEGCVAGYCYDFKAIGEKAGSMAEKIIHGESAAGMAVEIEREGTLYVNKDRIKDLYLAVPDAYKSKATEVSTSYQSK